MSRRSVLAAAIASAWVAGAAGPAGAEPAAPEATPPTEIVITGARREDRGVLVTVVDEKKIERFGATTVGETLERLPAFSGGADSRGERILSLRGFDQRQIAVFVDGVPVYVPYDGQLDLSKLPVDMVTRVTAVKGAGSLLYGPNGLGGAVNIVTREPTERPSLRMRTETSPWSATRASAVASSSLGPAGAIVGLGLESRLYSPMSARFSPLPNEDGGRRNNSDRRASSLASRWTWDVSDAHRLTLSASRFEGTFGVPPATRDFTVRYWRWTDWASSTVGLSHAYRAERWQTEELVYASLFSNTLDSYDDARYATQALPRAFHSVYDDTSMGGVVRTTYSAPLDGERALRVRTWAGVKHDVHESVADRGAGAILASTSTLTASAQGELELAPPWLRGAVGVQGDGELPDTPPSGPTPRAAFGLGPMATLSAVPSAAWSVTASAANRMRFPTLRERFSTVFGGREPNPLLGPERAWNLALDVVFKPDRALRVAAGVFDSELRDLIASVVVRPQTEQLQNVSRSRLVGAEGEVQWAPSPWLEVLAGWMELRARSGDALDQPIAYRPGQKGLLAVTVTPWPSVSLTGVMRYVGAQDFQNPDTGVWGRLGAYRLFDARADWALHPALRAWVRATNVTDANVEARYSFPEAGRQVFVGLGSQVGS